jgi:hypothetical protein
MQTLKSVVTGLCSMALVLTPVAAPLAGAVAEEPWEIVPEDSLRDLRGGMDMGDLVASFAIERVVEINGMVVARMQLVISNLDRLAKGGMPTITVTGPMAEIVQFMKTAGNVSVAGSNASIPVSVASLPATQSTAAAAAAAGAAASAAASTGPTVASTGNSGTVSATGTQSGSMAQMGNALTHAVTAAANATAQTSGATAPASPSTASGLANSASSAANAPSIAASNTHLQASATPTVSAQPASTSAASTTRTIPVGTTGQAVVLSNLPNAAALTTAVQNEVHAATIQTQTTISATINSMPALNAISLSNSIRAAVSGGG